VDTMAEVERQEWFRRHDREDTSVGDELPPAVPEIIPYRYARPAVVITAADIGHCLSCGRLIVAGRLTCGKAACLDYLRGGPAHPEPHRRAG
jgi:hypothetical protein